MTVSYTGDVANGSSFGCFWKILIRWRGSVYKLIWRELIAYLILYFFINACYRLGMDEAQKRAFEKVKVYCSKQIESIPMSFVLGFYVSLIVKRWWDQYWILPLPDSLALYISASLNGQDERGRILRRTIMRYAILSFIITLQRISFRVKKRFPTLQHLVDAGLMMESEKKIFDKLDMKSNVSKFWMPIVWASNLVNRARLEGRIQSDHMVQTIVTELSDFRRRLGRVTIYDTVSVPLVYTQVVTLAVYTYFIAALVGRQWVNPPQPWRSKIYPNYELDLYFPVFLSLQFIFYIGWLKVAETLINPFGEDDDDFELNWLIDRHIQVSYMVVDEMHEEHPELLKDHYWEDVVPTDLPYNIASEQFRRTEPQGSTASMKIKPGNSVYANLASVKRHNSVAQDEVYADYASVTDSPLADNRKNWLQRQLSRVESFRSTSSSSSLFIRTKSQDKRNGHLPNVYTGGSGAPPVRSFYDRLLNRRSSKEPGTRFSPKIPPGLSPSRALESLPGSNTLSPHSLHPQLRPRVPTPDVSKENQFHLTAPSPLEKGAPRIASPSRIDTNNLSPLSVPVPNPPYNNNNSNNNNINNNNTAAINNLNALGGATAARNSRNVVAGEGANILGSRSKSPVPFDNPDPHVLSPIEENDGSPYSTSLASRSSKSSNYPTTTAIFGRKPSPPPPNEGMVFPSLPSEPSSGNNKETDGKFITTKADEVDHIPAIEELENVLGEDHYMTIAEVTTSSKPEPGSAPTVPLPPIPQENSIDSSGGGGGGVPVAAFNHVLIDEDKHSRVQPHSNHSTLRRDSPPPLPKTPMSARDGGREVSSPETEVSSLTSASSSSSLEKHDSNGDLNGTHDMGSLPDDRGGTGGEEAKGGIHAKSRSLISEVNGINHITPGNDSNNSSAKSKHQRTESAATDTAEYKTVGISEKATENGTTEVVEVFV